MDLPIDVDVFCSNGRCGRSTSIVLNPVKDEVTHLVVREKHFPHIERLVPIGSIAGTTPEGIHLKCAQNELHNMDAFLETEFIRSDEVDMMLSNEDIYPRPYFVWPYVIPDQEPIGIEQENIPLEEIAVHRGEEVYATDGRVGKVDELLIEPESGRITHLVLRSGHLWEQKEVTIPVANIAQLGESRIVLKLDTDGIRMLPTISVRRKWL
jgi:sporulation protein YlmC with PRC-barrel domain